MRRKGHGEICSIVKCVMTLHRDSAKSTTPALLPDEEQQAVGEQSRTPRRPDRIDLL